MKTIVTILVIALHPLYGAFAQCMSQGPHNGTNFSDNNSTGVYAFVSPGNASLSDNNRASASAILSVLSGNTHYLQATGFGFNIPSYASICGIVVEVEKSAGNINLFATVTDNAVRLVKGGVTGGNNYAKGSDWTSSDTYYSYGGSADTWGMSWTPADINATDFGVAVSANINGLISLLPSAQIDHIRITVYYNPVLPVHFVDVSAKAVDENKVEIKWNTADNDEDARFFVERSADQKNWLVIAEQNGKQSAGIESFSVYDWPKEGICFYRVRMMTASGMTQLSKICMVQLKTSPNLSFYPNPCGGELMVETPGIQTIYCMDVCGRRLGLSYDMLSSGRARMDVGRLRSGVYFIYVNGEVREFLKR